jgi:hypothetical protein
MISMTVDTELGKMCREAAVAKFKGGLQYPDICLEGLTMTAIVSVPQKYTSQKRYRVNLLAR